MTVPTATIPTQAGTGPSLADRPGSTADDLADACELDPFYVSVWCRAANGLHLKRSTSRVSCTIVPAHRRG